MRSPFSLIPFALLAVAGCAPATQFTPTNPSPQALTPRPAGEVEVFTAAAPLRPFVEVGVLETEANTLGEAVNLLRAQAARSGCDGVILHPPREVSNDYPSRHLPDHHTEYTAACFVYK